MISTGHEYLSGPDPTNYYFFVRLPLGGDPKLRQLGFPNQFIVANLNLDSKFDRRFQSDYKSNVGF